MKTFKVIEKVTTLHKKFPEYSFGDLMVAMLVSSKITLGELRKISNEDFCLLVKNTIKNEQE